MQMKTDSMLPDVVGSPTVSKSQTQQTMLKFDRSGSSAFAQLRIWDCAFAAGPVVFLLELMLEGKP